MEGREEVKGGFTGAVRREETVTGEEGRDGATTGEVVAGVAVVEGVAGAGGAAEGAGALAAWKQAGGAEGGQGAEAAVLDAWCLAAR